MFHRGFVTARGAAAGTVRAAPGFFVQARGSRGPLRRARIAVLERDAILERKRNPSIWRWENGEDDMKTFAKFATAAAVAGALALSMATPSYAASYRHQQWSHSSRDAAANGYDNGYADRASGYADPGYGSYAYAPRSVSGSTVNEQQCMMSPGSQNYEPCFNY
jgi:hypothetical protein